MVTDLRSEEAFINGRPPAILHVGTYAAAGGDGVYPISRSSAGSWVAGAPVSETQNASYAAYSARFDLHYLVDEMNGTIGVFRVADGWRRLATLSSGGCEPCYIALDPAETALAIANYGSGTLTYYRLDPASGLPVGPPKIRQNDGHGPDGERQEGPHGHCAQFSPDGRWLYYVDLGTDQILAYSHDAATGEVGDAVLAFAAAAGSGPRHLVFSANGIAYLISELASSVTLLAVDGARLIEQQTVSTLPSGFAGSSLAGHIALNADRTRLYVSNCGHDSIATFAVGDDGRLDSVIHAPSGGRSPRFFLPSEDGRQLVVAHEQDGAIRIGGVDENGRFRLVDSDLCVPGAAFLFFA